jgi:glycerophosphoryl diester phosphodiesterase
MQPPMGPRAFDWLITRPIAHRGLHDAKRGVVENTRSAFAAAMASNYAIECDVQLTADGEAVVFHDDTLDRLALAQGPLIARTSAELKSIALRGSTDRIETLADLLAQIRGRVALIIELKSAWNGNVALALRALQALRSYSGPCALMSFDPDLIEVLRCAPHIPRGIVAERVTRSSWQALPLARRLELRHLRHWQRTLPHFISFDAGGLPWPPVTQLRAAGLPVITWTVRSEDEATAVRRYCDQITFEGFLP